MTKTLHYKGETVTMCGFSLKKFREDALVGDWGRVTCKGCLNVMERRKRREAPIDLEHFHDVMSRPLAQTPIPTEAASVSTVTLDRRLPSPRKIVHYKPINRRSLMCNRRVLMWSEVEFTDHFDQVNCQNCLGAIERSARRGEEPWRGLGAIAYERRLQQAAERRRETTQSGVVHWKPTGWLTAACGLSLSKYPALACTIDPQQVGCNGCLKIIDNRIGRGVALHADAIREITTITLDIATKQDIADLKTFVETRLRELVTELNVRVVPRHLDIDACAAYLGRTVSAIYMLVHRGEIPHLKIGRRVQFDKERIDRWLSRHHRNGATMWRRGRDSR